MSEKQLVRIREMARHLDISERALRKLIDKGIIKRAGRYTFDVDACRLAYIRHLRGALNVKPSDVPELSEARAKQALSAARVNDLKVAELEGKLVRRDMVDEIFGRVAAALRSGFAGLAAKARGRIPHLTPADAKTIDELVGDILRDIPQNAGLPEPLETEGEDENRDAGADSGGK